MTFEQAAARCEDLVGCIGDGAFAIGRYGDHAGRISLRESDGVCCEPNLSGHFDLHEAADVNWSGRVEKYFELGSEV